MFFPLFLAWFQYIFAQGTPNVSVRYFQLETMTTISSFWFNDKS